MSTSQTPLQLPNYHEFLELIESLALPISASELHGLLCGYLCAGAINEGSAYLRALMSNKNDAESREAALAIFEIYAVSQQQINHFDFEFQMLLPDDEVPLVERAQAFSEWCEGFTQGITLVGVGQEQLHEEEAQEALQHMVDFAQLDYESMEVEEADEKAFWDVSEYARMAVLRIHADLLMSHLDDPQSETAH